MVQVLGGATGQANVKLLLLTYLWAYPNVYVVSRFLYGVSMRGIKKGLDKKIRACTCYNKVGFYKGSHLIRNSFIKYLHRRN